MTLPPEVRDLHNAFLRHVMGEAIERNCCNPPTRRYCEEGKRLWEAYDQAARAAITRTRP